MSRNQHRYGDDIRLDDLEELDELDVPKFEKFSPHKKNPDNNHDKMSGFHKSLDKKDKKE
jgi:hypothetical protein